MFCKDVTSFAVSFMVRGLAMTRWWPRSLAGQAFALQLVVLAVVVVGGSVLALLESRRDVDTAARDQVVGIATALANAPSTAAAIESGTATQQLQPLTEAVRKNTGITFITIMAPDGTRFTHPNPQQIGKEYLGTTAPALRGETFTEEYLGTLGTSIRAVAPVRDRSGRIVGLVSAGITTSRCWIASLKNGSGGRRRCSKATSRSRCFPITGRSTTISRGSPRLRRCWIPRRS